MPPYSMCRLTEESESGMQHRTDFVWRYQWIVWNHILWNKCLTWQMWLHNQWIPVKHWLKTASENYANTKNYWWRYVNNVYVFMCLCLISVWKHDYSLILSHSSHPALHWAGDGQWAAGKVISSPDSRLHPRQRNRRKLEKCSSLHKRLQFIK